MYALRIGRTGQRFWASRQGATENPPCGQLLASDESRAHFTQPRLTFWMRKALHGREE